MERLTPDPEPAFDLDPGPPHLDPKPCLLGGFSLLDPAITVLLPVFL